MRTTPEFRAAHHKFLRNPEGSRIHEKLGRSDITFRFDVGTSKELGQQAQRAVPPGKVIGGLTDRSQLDAKNVVTIVMNKEVPSDKSLYHEHRHGENTIDNRNNPNKMASVDDTLDAYDESDFGEKLYEAWELALQPVLPHIAGLPIDTKNPASMFYVRVYVNGVPMN